MFTVKTHSFDKMKFFLFNLFLLFSFSIFSQHRVAAEDLKRLIGEWEGQITYLDYQTNKPFTMDANLSVRPGRSDWSLILSNDYPSEPKANNTEKIRVTRKGETLNKSRVTVRKELNNGQIEIQTENQGKDDNKKATIRYTYLIGQTSFLIRKEVQFNEEAGWVKRNEFSYAKKSPDLQ